VLQLVLYFGVLAAAASGPAHQLLRAFTAPDTSDAWRNGRFKIIPGVEAGPWIVRKAVGNKSTPAILGKQLKQTFSSSPGVFEVAVDCNSSPAAGRIVSMVKSQARHLAVDLAFLIEPQSASELAERVRRPRRGGTDPRIRLALAERTRPLLEYSAVLSAPSPACEARTPRHETALTP